jgi:hypothetical protein
MPESTKSVYPDGTIEWHLNGKLHRVDGPAVVVPGTYEAWYLNGELHRVDGPALSFLISGNRKWYLNGKPHREDGPAVEQGDYIEWWLKGNRLTYEAFISSDLSEYPRMANYKAVHQIIND